MNELKHLSGSPEKDQKRIIVSNFYKVTLIWAFMFLSVFASGYDNFDSAFKGAKEFGEANKNQEALAAFQEGLKFSTTDWQKFKVLTGMSSIYYKEKKYKDAENMIQELYKIKLTNGQMTATIVMLSANIYADQGKTDKAAAELKRVRDEIGEDNTDEGIYYLYMAAEIYCNKIKDYESSLNLIKKLEANEKTPQWIKNRMGTMKETIAKNKK
ncbi:MAG: hypothetical protein WCI51_18445 [Lentisphaerota bacterium]